MHNRCADLEKLLIDDQPIDAQFFGTGKWLTDFITPDAPDVKLLAQDFANGDVTEKLAACHRWVASKIRYKPFIFGRLTIDGYTSSIPDLWAEPSLTMAVGVGNCATKSFLLTSIIRNFLPPEAVSCVLGNLDQENLVSGHSWVEIDMGDRYIMESTRADIQPLVLASCIDRYESVIYFNDKGVSVVPGRTALRPFTAVYADWLREYLDMAYIASNKRRDASFNNEYNP